MQTLQAESPVRCLFSELWSAFPLFGSKSEHGHLLLLSLLALHYSMILASLLYARIAVF
jgi:hypothetical protein